MQRGKAKREGNRTLSRSTMHSQHCLPVPLLSVLWENANAWAHIRSEMPRNEHTADGFHIPTSLETQVNNLEKAVLDKHCWGKATGKQAAQKREQAMTAGPAELPPAGIWPRAVGARPPHWAATGSDHSDSTCHASFMRSITISSQAWATKLNKQEKKKKTDTRNKPGFFSSSLCCLCVDRNFFPSFALSRQTLFHHFCAPFLQNVYLQEPSCSWHGKHRGFARRWAK